MKRIISRSALALLFAGAVALTAHAAPDEKARANARKLATETCSACHGAGGQSQNPTFPNLASQQPAYLIKQLHAFRDHTRGEQAAHDFMWGMAKSLDDETIEGLAAYYSELELKRNKSKDTALIARGRALFEQGVPDRQIPPCAACHGAEGRGQIDFPRLSGQHADYLVKQLELIQSALRKVPAMHGIVQTLTRQEMIELAVFLESN